MKKIAVIALGSNLEQPAEQIYNALSALDSHLQIRVLKTSSFYRTKPVGYTDQPDFVNAVSIIETDLDAPELLATLHIIEAQAGRERTFRNAPRTLDLDIIDYAHYRSDDPALTLPHPRAAERSFVMVPLAEIAPDFELGGLGKAAEIAAGLEQGGIEKLPKE
ncbi:2-amino-4-hydroxy-6-hydroxymethyldihydropteridine diphosphokinase [Neisseria wadsworthii]|uniref:2-amino-4-hydroxy-6-hydroxymethyldihydropteridine pyrophosphokinase n=1 Tax=Neisseria wadsworthii 9715 TaxID=1030841 RepID=G4CRC7_9NEIS|nr:2-amino-4-hydroxy-6-hydroxymethyldihydropteridine diphosphokinase [Neisseria wadsworthii]EGZ45347.1 2-amino-4-hydroxy-6-hydroxymethyldihydropteridine diphosphokinase [Neisseria wadsworthii 9715]QMT35336.1 2-amino-4-hydroxy-6-hydroxymethyldihydropteridine diphosphokinase [Neisseria wadsworthii]